MNTIFLVYGRSVLYIKHLELVTSSVVDAYLSAKNLSRPIIDAWINYQGIKPSPPNRYTLEQFRDLYKVRFE